MTAILLIGKTDSRKTLLINLAHAFGEEFKRFAQSSAAMGFVLDTINNHQFYGVPSSTAESVRIIQRQCTCIINIIESVFGSSGLAETQLLGKPTYNVYLHDLANEGILAAIKRWIDPNVPQEDESHGLKSVSPPPPPPKIPDPSVVFQQQFKALQKEEQIARKYPQKFEQEQFQGIQKQFQQEQIAIMTNSIRLAPVLHDWSSTSPILKTFGSDVKNPIHRANITFTEAEFVYLMNTLQTTVRQIMQKYYRNHMWKNYGQYVSKISSGIPGYKSFLIFTKSQEPGAFYILVRSNIHIARHSPQTAEGDVLWAAGSTKKVKLYGLLLKFKLEYPNIIPDPILPVKQVVTFTWPASLKLSIPGTTKAQRTQEKSVAMQKLLTHQKDKLEFAQWDGLLAFSSGTPPIRKILAYQIFAGQSFDKTFSILNNLSSDQKLYAILSLLTHLKFIICEQHTWPSDIKLQNLAYSPTSAGPGYYRLQFIDFQSRVLSYTMLFNGQSDYSHLIFPPALVTTEKCNSYMHQLDERNSTWSDNSTRFKVVAYHLCFELILCLFFIMNDSVRNSYKKLFFYNQPWIKEPDLAGAIDAELNKNPIPHPPVNGVPFFSTLVKYTYHQDFFYDSSKTAFDVLKDFFEVLRNEIQTKIEPSLISGPRMSPHIAPLADDDTQILSNRWINTISAGFQNIKNTPRTSTTVQIEEIEPI